MISIGLFGMVDQVPGSCHVATRFFYIGIPVLPLDSWAVVERKELVSVGFLVQTVTGLPTTEGSKSGVRVPFSFKSVLVTYIRTLLWPIHGVATAILVMLVLVGLIMCFDSRSMESMNTWPWAVIGRASCTSAVSGFLLWQSYRRTHATPARAAELRAMLGLTDQPSLRTGVGTPGKPWSR